MNKHSATRIANYVAVFVFTFAVCFLGACGETGVSKRTTLTGDTVVTPESAGNKPAATGDTSGAVGTLLGVPVSVIAQINSVIPLTFSVLGVENAKINVVKVKIPDSGILDQSFPISGGPSAHIEIAVPGMLTPGAFSGTVRAEATGGVLLGISKFDLRVNP